MSPTFDAQRFLKRFGVHGHNGLVGLQYVSHDIDHVELSTVPPAALAYDEANTEAADGALITLLDMAATMAVWARIGGIRAHATVDLRVDHLLVPRTEEPLFARAECYHIDEPIASVRGTARTAHGAPVAFFSGAYMFLSAR